LFGGDEGMVEVAWGQIRIIVESQLKSAVSRFKEQPNEENGKKVLNLADSVKLLGGDEAQIENSRYLVKTMIGKPAKGQEPASVK
jgi:hypothetical protein